MRVFSCSNCGGLTNFDDAVCVACDSQLGFLPGTHEMLALDADRQAELEGKSWSLCVRSDLGCNWLVETGTETRCLSCRLVRRHPERTDELGVQQLSQAAFAERRLLFQLIEHDLPITPYYEQVGGLAFDLLSSMTQGERVITGHDDGIVTIDLSEVGDAYRESLRVQLGEPYRTMLGHFRHEIGHYYQEVLVPGEGPVLERCRELFGDETASYTDALERHYKHGAPADWAESHISEYATMHPWEDFAETWAHYLHITDTLQTAGSFGLGLGGLGGDQIRASLRGTLKSEPPAVSLVPYHDVSFDRVLDVWHPVSLMFNQINRSMGKNDVYPFVIPLPVREKLGFVHELVADAAGEGR